MKTKKWFYGLTISHHLAKHNLLTKEELRLEIRYARRVLPFNLLKCYCIFIIPIVLLLKAMPFLNKTAAKIARAIWIDHAIERELMYESRRRSKSRRKKKAKSRS